MALILSERGYADEFSQSASKSYKRKAGPAEGEGGQNTKTAEERPVEGLTHSPLMETVAAILGVFTSNQKKEERAAHLHRPGV